MNIVYITPRIPYPPVSGGVIKTLSTLRGLIHEGCSVSLFGFGPKNSGGAGQHLLSLGIRSVTFFPRELVWEKQPLLHGGFLLRSLVKGVPYTLEKFFDRGLRNAVWEHCRRHVPDIVWIDHFNLIPYVPPFFAGKSILEEHNIQSLLFFRLANSVRHPLLRLVYRTEARAWEAYERRYLPGFSRIGAISTYDCQYLAKHYFLGSVGYLGATLPIFHKTKPRKKQLLFAGSLTWKPNREGLSWFLRSVWPNLRSRFPQYRFVVVGDYVHTPPSQAGVEYLGQVADVRRYFLESSALVCPIFAGSGIRVKILQALAHGLPVVSTTVGAEGIPVINGKSILLRDDAMGFVVAVERLLTDHLLAHRIERGGRDVVTKYYSQEAHRRRIRKILKT